MTSYIRQIALTLIMLIMTMVSVQAKEVSETIFFDSLYDVPVMPGLVEVSELGMSFDKPNGRISQAAATYAGVKIESIYVFYDQSLSQMGWRKAEQGVYSREGEKLSISVTGGGQNSQENQSSEPIVRFLLEPQ